jgi:hypothetical protein
MKGSLRASYFASRRVMKRAVPRDFAGCSVPVLSAGKTLVFLGFFAFRRSSFGRLLLPCRLGVWRRSDWLRVGGMVGAGLRTDTLRPLLDEKVEPRGYPLAGLCRQLEDRDPRPHPL